MNIKEEAEECNRMIQWYNSVLDKLRERCNHPNPYRYVFSSYLDRLTGDVILWVEYKCDVCGKSWTTSEVKNGN